jgi:hypothetical protein
MVAQAASDQRFVLDWPEADGEVDPLACEVDAAIGEGQLQLDVGVAGGERRHQRHNLAQAEAVAEADSQRAARAQAAGADQLLRRVELLQDLARALVEQEQPPSAVGATLRVVRCKRRAPSRSSRRAISLLTAEGERRMLCAAAVRLPCSTTCTNTAISPA